MGSTAIALPKVNLAELLKLVGLPSKTSQNERTAELVGRANESVRAVGSVIDDLVFAAIDKRTAEDFKSARGEVFPQYFFAMRALGDLARIVIPKATRARLSAEWFSELEADFRDRGPSTFGSDLAERGIFTVWILRKIHDLAHEITATTSPKESEAEDVAMATDFAFKGLWTRFHVDCLTKSMRDNRPPYPEVVEPIRDGLRTAVNTYACIRQWADLRNPKSELELGPIEWTDADELLLADSMEDLEQKSA